jgi:hypothetical protein
MKLLRNLWQACTCRGSVGYPALGWRQPTLALRELRRSPHLNDVAPAPPTTQKRHGRSKPAQAEGQLTASSLSKEGWNRLQRANYPQLLEPGTRRLAGAAYSTAVIQKDQGAHPLRAAPEIPPRSLFCHDLRRQLSRRASFTLERTRTNERHPHRVKRSLLR